MKDINQSLGDLGCPPHSNCRHLARARKDVHRLRAILELVGHIEHALGKFCRGLPNFRPKLNDRIRPSLSLLFGYPRKSLNLRDCRLELRLRIDRRRTNCENRCGQVMRKRSPNHHPGRTQCALPDPISTASATRNRNPRIQSPGLGKCPVELRKLSLCRCEIRLQLSHRHRRTAHPPRKRHRCLRVESAVQGLHVRPKPDNVGAQNASDARHIRQSRRISRHCCRVHRPTKPRC